MDYSAISSDERAIFSLRSLYKKYGYTQFKMSKFEEYDLYVKNKDYLVSENIIAFTDTDGKLMALKPDVTLSIIKSRDEEKGGVQKVFYDENVYRVSKSTHNFKEITQVGLECIGEVGLYNIFEVIQLAAKSLENISPDYVLDISNMDIVSDLIFASGISGDDLKAVIKCIEEKNVHGIEEIFAKYEKSDYCAKLKRLISLRGNAKDVIDEIKAIAEPKSENAVASLEKLMLLMGKIGFSDKVRIDFSVISDANYYNGFVFKGFINGISSRVLSGGQYDNLMKKMSSRLSAVGFAVYLDMLADFKKEATLYDTDAVILYDKDDDLESLAVAVNKFADNGKSVTAVCGASTDIKCKTIYKLCGSVVETIENNA